MFFYIFGMHFWIKRFRKLIFNLCSFLDPSMVLKLLPGHSSRGGGVIDSKGEEEKGEEKKMAQEKGNEEGGDPIIDSLGEIGK